MTSLCQTSFPHCRQGFYTIYPMFRTPLSLLSLRSTHCSVRSDIAQFASPLRKIQISAGSTRSGASLEKQLSAYIQQQQRQHFRRKSTFPSTSNMSFLLPGLRRGMMLSAPLILSTPLLAYQLRNSRPIYCDGPDPLTKITNDLTSNYTSEAKTPIVTQSGTINPRAIRQVSMGSILGVIGGLGISVFSKPLAILIGLGIFVLQVSQKCTDYRVVVSCRAP